MSVTTVSSDSSSGNSYLTDAALARSAPPLSRYESQKRRDWNTFGQYLKNHRPPLALARCSGAHVLEFLRYLDQFGKTKVHTPGCPFFGHPHPPAPCPCPLRQAWGSLDALIGRLRAAFEENGGQPEANPFATRAVRLYLREVRDSQAKARGIAYEKKKRRKAPPRSPPQQVQPILHLSGTIPPVDLNLVNGGYPPPHHLLFRGHVLVPPPDQVAYPITLPPPPSSSVGAANNPDRSTSNLLNPERLLLCEM